jgi:farnesyl-diphosphate farnesyltransferase
MRAIDEIEDHPDLDNLTKSRLLKTISSLLQAIADRPSPETFSSALLLHSNSLPEVSLRIGEWALMAPDTIAPRIWDATAAMADRMAHWAEQSWNIQIELELDRYTFSVAGAVGLLLSDLWSWYDHTATNRTYAIGFGRGLQAVNILRNRAEDLKRGADFFPNGWSESEMFRYARRNLSLADKYTQALPKGPALEFCQIPLTLAHGTLNVMAMGEKKLTREAVLELVERVTRKK